MWAASGWPSWLRAPARRAVCGFSRRMSTEQVRERHAHGCQHIRHVAAAMAADKRGAVPSASHRQGTAAIAVTMGKARGSSP